eukprot:TRINITY_DN875_c0_g1_i2.p1 TRINITY_DN875_c0_g1~~TRINITY_DN875_c0_g1_i2.p1  ORF type:complete len:478 (-),score=91.73 TRINITY_DN875_c0_g1_i2:253-1653(-)
MSKDMDEPHENSSKFSIFFRVGHQTRKSDWYSTWNMDDLSNLFCTKFQNICENQFLTYPMYIKDEATGIRYELENTEDLYPGCVLEYHPQSNSYLSNPIPKSETQKFIIVMVGLPARGKSYIARKISYYLKWIGCPTKVFNVGKYRREKYGSKLSNQFYDPENEEGKRLRSHVAILALDEMIEWVNTHGSCAIFDATNSTDARRKLIRARCAQEKLNLMFLEIINDDEEKINMNIREGKLHLPDYENIDDEIAFNDFRERIKHYQKGYEEISDNSLCYVKMINSDQLVINRINQYLTSKVVFFLMKLHHKPRKIILSRHGESEYNIDKRIGGNGNLTPKGELYASKLSEWIMDNMYNKLENGGLSCWTSTLNRTVQTAQYLPIAKEKKKALDEIYAGQFEGMTYNEIAENHPDEFKARLKNKLTYRYPGGEAYTDVIARLENIIYDIESTENDLIIVSHQATLRCL